MEIIAVILFFGIAVWYLFRRFRNIADPNQSFCNCRGCECCSTASKILTSKRPSNDQNQ